MSTNLRRPPVTQFPFAFVSTHTIETGGVVMPRAILAALMAALGPFGPEPTETQSTSVGVSAGDQKLTVKGRPTALRTQISGAHARWRVKDTALDTASDQHGDRILSSGGVAPGHALGV